MNKGDQIELTRAHESAGLIAYPGTRGRFDYMIDNETAVILIPATVPLSKVRRITQIITAGITHDFTNKHTDD